MANKKSYEIKSSLKKIIVDVERMTDEDKKIIMNYKDFGYTIEPKIKEKKKVHIPSLEEKQKNPYSEINIRKFLEDKGTEEQREQYNKLYNDLMKDKITQDVVKYKKDVKDDNGNIIHKAGEKRVKGHVHTLKWFKETFPDYETCDWVKKNVLVKETNNKEKSKEEDKQTSNK
ncbi:MAG: hypothetical protein IJW32_00070 [Clostridia bacterium]|nr:hypothetical protein [Clostridia bacterium]MBQ9792129.1 hypothetical protein [Clostridia bacterium]